MRIFPDYRFYQTMWLSIQILLHKIITGTDNTYFGNLIFYHIYPHTSFFIRTHRMDSTLMHDPRFYIITSWHTLTLPSSVPVKKVPRVSQTTGFQVQASRFQVCPSLLIHCKDLESNYKVGGRFYTTLTLTSTVNSVVSRISPQVW